MVKGKKNSSHFHIRYDSIFVGALFLFFLLWAGSLLAIPTTNQKDVDQPWIEVSYGEKNLRMNSWYDEQEQQLYFFLPSSIFAESSGRLQMPENTELVLGVVSLRTGDILPEIASQAEGVLRFYDGERAEKSQTVILMFSSTLPAVYIETQSGSLDSIHADKDHKEEGSMLIVGTNGDTDYDGKLTYIKGRGQSSLKYPKRNYTIKLPSATSLLDMGAGISWVLCANVIDASGLKNHIVYDTAREAGLTYAVEDVFVDLFINHEYLGLYQVIEGIEVGESRVNVEDLAAATQAVNSFDLSDYPELETERQMYSSIPHNPVDITGGYLLEMDFPVRYALESSGVITRHNKHVVVVSPEYCSLEQIQYIADVVNEAEEAIYATDGIHPTTGKPFTEYIDLASWVKRYLIDEIFMNFDAEATSSYFYKYAGDERLYAGPAWDYDNSMTNKISSYDGRWIQSQNPEAFYASNEAATYNEWYQNLYRQPVFYEALVTEYQNVFLPLINEWLEGKLVSCSESMQSSVSMNNLRWKELKLPTDEEEQMEEVVDIQSFLTRRIEFLNSVWIREETYYTVKIVFQGGTTEFLLKPGETLFEEISQTVPTLKDRSFFQDAVHESAFDLHTSITEDITLYMAKQRASETSHAVYVGFSSGGGEGFYLKPGQSFWEGVLEQRSSWQNQQFYTDKAHTIEFDVHAPITRDTTLYLKTFDYEKNQNLILLAVIVFLGIVLLAVEIRKKHGIRRKGGKNFQ